LFVAIVHTRDLKNNHFIWPCVRIHLFSAVSIHPIPIKWREWRLRRLASTVPCLLIAPEHCQRKSESTWKHTNAKRLLHAMTINLYPQVSNRHNLSVFNSSFIFYFCIPHVCLSGSDVLLSSRTNFQTYITPLQHKTRIYTYEYMSMFCIIGILIHQFKLVNLYRLDHR